MLAVQRISNFSYRATNQELCETPVILYTLPLLGTPEFRHRLASAAARVLFDEDGKVHLERGFDYGLLRWKFSAITADPVSWATWAISKVTSMVHTNTWTTVSRALITPSWGIGSYLNPIAYFRELQPHNSSHRRHTIEAIQATGKDVCPKLVEAVSEAEWEQGVRAAVAFSDCHHELSAPRFQDPYSRLASLAFQYYESDFSASDGLTPKDCCTRIVLDGDNRLTLINHQACSEEHKDRLKQTARQYRDYLALEIGDSKLNYLEHLFHIDLIALTESGDGLTPEHVYRMNLGCQMVEQWDLEAAIHQLVCLQEETTIDCLSAEAALPKILWRGLYRELGDELPEGLNRLLTEKDLTREQLEEAGIPNETQDWIISLLLPSEAERQAGYTGRPIPDNIRAYYTRAGLETYKPWIDLQELLHVFETIESNEDWEHFLEVMGMVLPKRQLVREHPTEGFRVGALIPAPPLAGKRRWYKVASCASNNHGILCYTLESLHDDPSLPHITLFRSTASSSYNLRWAASSLSDLNRLNSPGYQGDHLLADYFRNTYQERSIPVWCGYAYSAQLQLEILQNHNQLSVELFEPLIQTLESAQYEYLVAEASKSRPYTLSKLIRTFDYALNSLYYECVGFPPADRKEQAKSYKYLYENELLRLRLGSEPLDEVATAELATRLYPILVDLYSSEELTCNRTPFPELIDALKKHLCSDYQRIAHKEAVTSTNRSLNNSIGQLPELISESLAAKDFKTALYRLEWWVGVFMTLAFENNEHPDQKLRGGLALVGHSLGAAIAQHRLMAFLVKENRLPLPEESILGKFIYGPKINASDNQKYLDFGKRHWRLLVDLGSQIEICHHHEVGDPVFKAGEGQHLGSAQNQEQADQLRRFHKFDGRALERSEFPSSDAVSQSQYAHETPFHHPSAKLIQADEEDQEGDYTLHKFSELDLGVVDADGQDLETEHTSHSDPSLIKELWDLNSSLLFNVESWRTGTYMNGHRVWLEQQRRSEDRAAAFSDENGVFIVTDQGVQTKPADTELVITHDDECEDLSGWVLVQKEKPKVRI